MDSWLQDAKSPGTPRPNELTYRAYVSVLLHDLDGWSWSNLKPPLHERYALRWGFGVVS